MTGSQSDHTLTELGPGWLRDAIRILSQDAAEKLPSIKAGGPPNQLDPRFRKLVEGIIYSERLILTYHFIIIAFVLTVSALHWSQKAARWRTRRALRLKQGTIYDQDAETTGAEGKAVATSCVDETSSSGSSTTGGSSSPPQEHPPQEHPTEDTPFLQDGHQSQAHRPKRTLLSTIKAFLMYQPRPIPLVNKTLPSNGSTLLLLAFIALNIFYTLFHINFNVFELFIFADRCGIIFVANLPLLYILAAKTQPLKMLTGCSYESLNIYHRRLGEILCLEALLHTVGMFGVWYTLLRPISFTLVQFLKSKVIILGLLAFISYESLYFTSLASFRQRWYELFLGVHVILQVLALVFVFFHHPRSRIYVGTALGIFLIDRLVYRLGIKRTTAMARTKIMEDGDTVKLSTQISVRPSSSALFVGKSICSGWSATDHVFLTIPSLGRTHLLQAHPFTITSPAPTTNNEEATLDLIIRAQDGFSADLLKKARTHKNFTVRLDGPYGSSHAKSLLEDADLAIVVAGGSGIAVAWPLLNHLVHIDTDAEMGRKKEIVFIWVVRQDSHITWIGKQALEDIQLRGVRVVISEATEIAGRPDLEGMLGGIVEGAGGGGKGRIGVVASGPDEMGRTVRNTCSKFVGEGRDVGVTIEKFGW